MSDKTGISWTDATWRVCWSCRQSLPASAFGSDRSRPDGVNPVCRTCKNRRARDGYSPAMRPTRFGPRRLPRRDGDKRQARSRVNHDVRMGLRANPNELACVDCGHLGSDKRHEYDHHLGYAAEHHGDVEPVCSTCHHRREEMRRG